MKFHIERRGFTLHWSFAPRAGVYRWVLAAGRAADPLSGVVRGSGFHRFGSFGWSLDLVRFGLAATLMHFRPQGFDPP